jgi:hypothetical protein
MVFDRDFLEKVKLEQITSSSLLTPKIINAKCMESKGASLSFSIENSDEQ